MKKKASRLEDYLQRQMGDSLRAVGYYSPPNVEMTFLRDELKGQYDEAILKSFISKSQDIQHTLTEMDAGMGEPAANMHVLDNGLVIQFYYDNYDLIFFSMEKSVGREFSEFIEECQNQMGPD